MGKRNANYDDEEYWGANFLGTGCYQFIYEGGGESEIKQQIGFVRPKPKSGDCSSRADKT